jgi:hypothetical protein
LKYDQRDTTACKQKRAANNRVVEEMTSNKIVSDQEIEIHR